MAPYAEEGARVRDFRPTGGRTDTLIDLIREQSATKRQQLQQMAEEQNRAISEGWGAIQRGIEKIPGERRAKAAEERATEEQGFRRQAAGREQEMHPLTMKGVQLGNEGQEISNAGNKGTMEFEKKHREFLGQPGTTGKPLAEEQWGAEAQQPGLQNQATETQIAQGKAGIRATNAGIASQGLQNKLVTEQLTQLTNARTREDAALATAKIVKSLASAKQLGDTNLEQQILQGLSGIKSQAEVASIRAAAETESFNAASSRNLADQTNVGTVNALDKVQSAQHKANNIRQLADSYERFKSTPATSDKEQVELATFKQLAGPLGGGLSETRYGPRVTAGGIGNAGEMERIINTQMRELEGELQSLKSIPQMQQSPQVAQAIQALESEMDTLSQQTGIQRGPGIIPKADRTNQNKTFLGGGGRGGAGPQQPAPPPGQGRTMRGAGTTGAPAPMGAQPQQPQAQQPQQNPDYFVPAMQPKQVGAGFRG